jgi:hypothetical protein
VQQGPIKPHQRCETERDIPESLFVAALLTSGRLRLVPVFPETWQVSANERDRLLKRAIHDHYREHAGRVTAFGAIVGYTAVVMAGYRLDFGLPYDLDGDPVGPMLPVERLHEAALGIKRGDSRLTGLFSRYSSRYSCIGPRRGVGSSLRSLHPINQPSTRPRHVSPPDPLLSKTMPYAIIRGKNGRRHEVDFGDAPVRVEIYPSEETVEIFIEADFETVPEERRRFALINIPRPLFSEATAAAARRAANPVRAEKFRPPG